MTETAASNESTFKKGDKCPLCNGSKTIWGSCCSGRECGCYGLPVNMDCYLCKETGVLLEDIDPEMTEAILADVKQQEEAQEYMEDRWPEHFKK